MLLVAYVCALPAWLPLAFAAVARVEGSHGVALCASGAEMHVVLTHPSRCQGMRHEVIHRHGLAARMLASLAAPGDGPDHVVIFTSPERTLSEESAAAPEALSTAGAPGTPALTAAMHAKHADVVNPKNGLPLNHIANRSACYTCHPGSTTRCLRGAMGAAVASDGSASMQCQRCHGSTHAEFPAAHRNDNIQSVQLQGHVGVLTDCLACHATMPETTIGGPHGMHPIGEKWADDHADRARAVGLAVCQSCHGTDDRGTVLSRAQGDRSYTTKSEYGTPKRFWRGQEIGCYECHNGPGESDRSTRTRPVVSNATLAVAENTPTSLTLSATGTGTVAQSTRSSGQTLHGRGAGAV
jgi:hypothetical protein